MTKNKTLFLTLVDLLEKDGEKLNEVGNLTVAELKAQNRFNVGNMQGIMLAHSTYIRATVKLLREVEVV